MRFFSYIAISAIVLGVVMLIIETSLGLFFKSTETFNKLSVDLVWKLLIENSLIAAIAILLTMLIDYFRPRKPENNFDTTVPPLSVFTKIIIIFLGLPVLGLLLSMVPVRLFEILSISIDPKLTVVIFVLFFWGFGLFMFKNTLLRR